MNKHIGLVFNRKTGNVVKMLENDWGKGMLEMWGLQNLTKTVDYVVVSMNSGKIVAYYEGKGRNEFPNICKDMVGRDAVDIGIDVEMLK